MTGPQRFRTTRWSVVVAAGGPESLLAKAALEDLCGAYWLPLYSFARRRGASEHEAQDLTQAFFAALLEKNYVADADRQRGKFRTFLLTSFRHHCSKEREKAAAQKRGGGRVHLSLDFDEGERRYRLEPTSDLTPERVFERRWALTTLERGLERVKHHHERAGDLATFEALEPFIAPGTVRPTYAETAERIAKSETAVKAAIRRLRIRYREALRAEIADTVPAETDIDAEVRELMEALA